MHYPACHRRTGEGSNNERTVRPIQAVVRQAPRLRPRLEGAHRRYGGRDDVHLYARGASDRRGDVTGARARRARAAKRNRAAYLRYVLSLLPRFAGAGIARSLRVRRGRDADAVLHPVPPDLQFLARARADGQVGLLPADAERGAIAAREETAPGGSTKVPRLPRDDARPQD